MRGALVLALKCCVLVRLGHIALMKSSRLRGCGNTGASVIYEMKWQELMNHTDRHADGERRINHNQQKIEKKKFLLEL